MADLIIMATRGESGLKRLLLGSTTERVIRFAPCPVLIPRGKTLQDGARSRSEIAVEDSEDPGARRFLGLFGRRR